MEKVALIMAGGKGERFWPRSRKNKPKQFLCLTNDGKTMIQHTVERISPLIDVKNIFIATNNNYKSLVLEQLPQIPEENILCEPLSRNTAPCIGLAAVTIQKKLGDSIMVVLPSDHLIKYNSMFVDTVRDACSVAQDDCNLVTIGIMPSYPETGYGYIKFNPKGISEKSYRVYPVEHIVEKPCLEKAKEYLASGQYFWNSGMFVWKTSSILRNLETYLPDTYQGLLRISETIGTNQYPDVVKNEFSSFKSESVDYGILEKAKDIFILPGTFGWDDVGSWLAMERINQTNEDGNVITGNVISIKTKDCIISGSEKLVAAVGLENLIVIDTPDAMLICTKDHSQDVKQVLENLKICNRSQYI